ncbi:MAG: carbohydrate ABC transporter permease [Chloroflexi bacterium]|uniref:carbohydrate ABC transporter permease n=1 Tax=Candidatus Flexifilum breve TaxID=3140694 RepID=UPI003136941E|nr:carbohydrate ABC transporter permease [Chloroflexota bacterium]
MASTNVMSASAQRPASRRNLAWYQKRLGRVLSWAFLLFIAMLTLMPFLWVVSTSLRTPAQSFNLPPEWIPVDMDFTNYNRVFEEIPFWQQMANSFFITLSVVFGQLLTASLAGYAFGRLKFPGRNILFWIVLATMMIPGQATIIPVFIVISRVLHLNDTLGALIFPGLATAFGTFLLRQYFMGIPDDFEEAALVEGANQWQIFTKIYFPLASPGMAILAVLTFNAKWNDYFTPLIFMSTKERFPITLGIVDLQGYMATGSISVVLAGIVLSTIPVIIIYILGQRYLVEGLMMGGVKG